MTKELWRLATAMSVHDPVSNIRLYDTMKRWWSTLPWRERRVKRLRAQWRQLWKEASKGEEVA